MQKSKTRKHHAHHNHHHHHHGSSGDKRTPSVSATTLGAGTTTTTNSSVNSVGKKPVRHHPRSAKNKGYSSGVKKAGKTKSHKQAEVVRVKGVRSGTYVVKNNPIESDTTLHEKPATPVTLLGEYNSIAFDDENLDMIQEQIQRGEEFCKDFKNIEKHYLEAKYNIYRGIVKRKSKNECLSDEPKVQSPSETSFRMRIPRYRRKRSDEELMLKHNYPSTPNFFVEKEVVKEEEGVVNRLHRTQAPLHLHYDYTKQLGNHNHKSTSHQLNMFNSHFNRSLEALGDAIVRSTVRRGAIDSVAVSDVSQEANASDSSLAFDEDYGDSCEVLPVITKTDVELKRKKEVINKLDEIVKDIAMINLIPDQSSNYSSD